MKREHPVSQSKRGLRQEIRELQKRATKDSVSGLLNRMAAEQFVKDRLREQKAGDNCALFIIDLDDFKKVNDQYGHLAGDHAIAQSAKILSGLFRASDIVGRLGGDEFIVFLSGKLTEQFVREKAAAVCESLQIAVGENPGFTLTASVGVFLSRAENEHFEGLYQSADLALYRAKKGGKHTFCLNRGSNLPQESKEDFHFVNTIPLMGLLEEMDSGVALLEMGEPMRIIYASPSFCRILGADPQNYAMPKLLSELVHPDDRLSLERALRSALKMGTTSEHTHRVSADGENWHWWHVRAVRITYRNPYPVLLVTTTDISTFKENERRLQEINERLSIALDQTTRCVWEVNLSTRQFRMFNSEGVLAVPEKGSVLFPEDLLAGGWVHENSVQRFREFAHSLLGGRVQGYGNFIFRDWKTQCYGWVSVSYRMVTDEEGCPVRAVGILENMPARFDSSETRSVLKRPLPEALFPDFVMGIRANLTRDAVIEWWEEGRNESSRSGEETLSQVLQLGAGKIFTKEARRRFANLFSRQGLLALYAQGERWMSAEYQRVEAGGSVCWVRRVINMLEDPITSEIYLYVYMARVDMVHDLASAAVGEPAAGEDCLYSERDLYALAEASLARSAGMCCAVAVISLGGFRQIYEGGESFAAKVRSLTLSLQSALGFRCVMARQAPDRFLVFFPGPIDQVRLRARMESAFSFVRLVLAGNVKLDEMRFVAGASVEPCRTANVSAMAAQVGGLCRAWKDAPVDTVVFPHEEDVREWPELARNEDRDCVTVHHEEMGRSLSENEKDIAFRCVSSMLSADSLETSLQSVLSYIGMYYHADRVYLLSLSAGQRILSMLFEWVSPAKRSIQQVVSGAQLSRFPLLQRCLKEQAPVFLTRTQPISLQGEQASGEPWYYTAFPLVEQEEVKGFLCVENAREHPADAALFSTLIPYILHERARFRSRPSRPEAVSSPVANPLNLPNLRSYMEVVFTLDSKRYSSMGVVCLDIPNLSAINGSLGFEYGSRLLWFTSKTLADLFGAGWLFRTWDAEFVALSPNTTRQAFLNKCALLRSQLTRRYPQDLRIGYTWDNADFTAKDLVNEAREIMQQERGFPILTQDGLMREEPGFQEVEEAMHGGRFLVYFQPKIEIRTGALYGAEVLVRGMREDGSLVLPGQFIEQLEQTGAIRNLDYFVLDRTLFFLDRWRGEGMGELHVSVNLSRVTLFSPSALASLLAIHSRYPAVPAECIEFEITESAGFFETDKLNCVIDRIRQCGFRVSLDDFGSKYANLPTFTNVKFDTVKLDRRFVTDLADNEVNRMLVRDIVQICASCGMSCVAEGVETQEQVDALEDVGCRFAQGYFYDRPMPAEKFVQKYLISPRGQANA